MILEIFEINSDNTFTGRKNTLKTKEIGIFSENTDLISGKRIYKNGNIEKGLFDEFSMISEGIWITPNKTKYKGKFSGLPNYFLKEGIIIKDSIIYNGIWYINSEDDLYFSGKIKKNNLIIKGIWKNNIIINGYVKINKKFINFNNNNFFITIENDSDTYYIEKSDEKYIKILCEPLPKNLNN